jgi:hypothetical protein
VQTDLSYTVPMPYDDFKAPAPAPQQRRAYRTPSLIIHGRMTELTETGNGSGKESSQASKRPVTLSNP